MKVFIHKARFVKGAMLVLFIMASFFLPKQNSTFAGKGHGYAWGKDGKHKIKSHKFLKEYNGPSTCVRCHREEAVQMFGAVHYQWTGPTPNATNIDGWAGKGDLGMNTYCGSVVTSRRVACWSCHVGYGKVPEASMTDEQLNNIDCMICHQDQYKRKAAPPYINLTFADHNGVSRTWTLPDEDTAGNFQFMPDEANMTISVLEAARTVHRPTRAACLSCHAYAAGSDCGKRGDLSSETANAPNWAETHMSPQGRNFSCQDCHQSEQHRVFGRGLDIRPNERPGWMTCFTGGCHTSTPHDNPRLNNHTGRVACQACHIRTYAKLRSTEVRRDWTNPFWFQGLFGGQGGFKPEEIRQSMLVPSYRWYDGTSRVYALGQQPEMVAGTYSFGLPNGGVNTPGAYIYPMKEHYSNSAMHDSTGQMIPHSVFTYFVTGDFNRAVQEGQNQYGLTGPWSMVDVHTYQTLNHGIEPAAMAISCGECHAELSNNASAVRMDLKGQLGYELKGPAAAVCTQCHELEENEGFVEIHEEHVSDEKINCSSCHNFTRPPRIATGDGGGSDD